jgi:integrase
MSKKVVTRTAVFERSDRPGRWTYDRGPIGGGKKEFFKSKPEAQKAMVEAVNNYNKGTNQEPIEDVRCDALIDKFITARTDLALVEEKIELASAQNSIRAIELARTFRVDGREFQKLNLFEVCKLQNKSRIATDIIRAVKNYGGDVKSQKTRFIFINMFFKFCVAEGFILMNPLEGKELTVKGEAIKDAKAPKIQPEIIAALLAAVEKEDIKSQAMINTYYESGVRMSELRGLPRHNVSCERDKQTGKYINAGIEISQTIKQDGQIGPPKSKNGYRFIPISDETMNLVEQVMLASPFKKPSDLVFANSNGKPADKHTLQRMIKRVARQSGMFDIPALEAQVVAAGGYTDGAGKWINISSIKHKLVLAKHIKRAVDSQLSNLGDFRHFFASAQFSKMKDWRKVTEYMGHHNSQFTEDQYQHQFVASKEEHGEIKNNMASFRI